ncbi:MAG TPA: hypothetical protein VMI06_17210 [Terriglobia bacterium]|nr:hypothetical protein [Terriglobia bacterium]
MPGAIPKPNFENAQGDAGDPGLVRYLEGRTEIGFWRLVVNLACEPRSIFKPNERRKVRKPFAVFIFTVFGLAAWFAWFNFIR